jgi:hypothetical protein
MNTDNGKPKLFDVLALVALLKSRGVSATIHTARALMAEVPRIRLGRKLYVTETGVDAYLERQERKGARR